MENEDLYRNLVILLKMFKNRPYHLAKYLVENSALTEGFIEKIRSNEKLKNLDDNKLLSSYFVDITQMENFYNSFVDEMDKMFKNKTNEEISYELNKKLDFLIQHEKYEEAARVRDYMVRNGIRRIS